MIIGPHYWEVTEGTCRCLSDSIVVVNYTIRESHSESQLPQTETQYSVLSSIVQSIPIVSIV